MQKHVNLVDLVKSFPTNILLQNLASIQERASPIKFDHLAEKSESALRSRTFQLRLPLVEHVPDSVGKNGWTPLMSAAYAGHEGCVDVLIKDTNE